MLYVVRRPADHVPIGQLESWDERVIKSTPALRGAIGKYISSVMERLHANGYQVELTAAAPMPSLSATPGYVDDSKLMSVLTS